MLALQGIRDHEDEVAAIVGVLLGKLDLTPLEAERDGMPGPGLSNGLDLDEELACDSEAPGEDPWINDSEVVAKAVVAGERGGRSAGRGRSTTSLVPRRGGGKAIGRRPAPR